MGKGGSDVEVLESRYFFFKKRGRGGFRGGSLIAVHNLQLPRYLE